MFLYSWKDLHIPITDGRFEHNGPYGSDIILVNVDYNNEMFAMVEIIKNTP